MKNKMRPQSLRTVWCFMCVIFMCGLKYICPNESQLFCTRKKPEHPQLEPHVGINMAQVLGSLDYPRKYLEKYKVF